MTFDEIANLYFAPDDPKRASLQSSVAKEPDLCAIMPYLQRGRTAIDIGAHHGTYSLAFSLVAEQVVAFEAFPSSARKLKRRTPDNVTVHTIALSDQSGETEFHIPRVNGRQITTRSSLKGDANDGFECDVIKVTAKPLDSYAFFDVSVIKIDVEGSERDVLKGAAETIARSKPALLIEIEDRHNPGLFWDTITSVLDRGYDGFFLDEGAIKPIDDFDPETQQNIANLKHPTGPAKGKYLNNFLFVPKDASA